MLYSEMVATKSAIHGDRKKILSFSPEEKPLALQVGGSNKEELSEVAKIAEDMGYDEININLGCPSKKVQKNKFGACLMKEPELVAECINSNYNMVYEIKKENPNLEIIINGGISKIEEIKNHISKCDGVMIGRSIYQNPYSLVDIEKNIFNTEIIPTREQVVEKLLDYVDKEVKLGTKVNHIMRHTVGLYHGQAGSKNWKRYLSDNMMARDSDFQKAKHIMSIVQNNEKAIQANS